MPKPFLTSALGEPLALMVLEIVSTPLPNWFKTRSELMTPRSAPLVPVMKKLLAPSMSRPPPVRSKVFAPSASVPPGTVGASFKPLTDRPPVRVVPAVSR